MDRTLSAFFDDRSDAVSAVDDLVAVGISREHIAVVSGSEPPEAGVAAGYGTEGEKRGFWASLADLFVPEEDLQTYEEGISRGGATVVARVEESQIDRAIDILENHNAADLDERERTWRSEGWTGPYTPGAASLGIAAGPGAPTTGATAAPVSPTAAPAPLPGGGAPSSTQATTGVSGEEEVIPVVREELHVGKREARSRHVRIHTHVVEEPFSEDIQVRDEHVTIERRPVDRPAGDIGEQAFQERTIEVEERHEEPVVSKEVRVTEELHVRKEAAEHVEHIEDKVRHTEVDVEDDGPAGGKGRG